MVKGRASGDGVTIVEEIPSTPAAAATRMHPGRLPGGKVVIRGTGTHNDPYIGTYFHGALNFNASTVSLPLMVESGDYAWMRIKTVRIHYAGTIGATIWLGGGMFSTDGSTTTNELPIGRPTTTTAAEDVLEWEPNILLWRSADPYTSVTGISPGHWTGELAIEVSGYAATDDLDVYAELEWAVRQ